MRQLKHKIDAYFELDGDTEGQVLYYGMIGMMAFTMIFGTLAKLFI